MGKYANMARGGMTDDGVDIEPTTGNEVPPGSLDDEVADDITIKVSGGEYIVPADVLQYYGMKFFEDLRKSAKGDLQRMESEGRIGGKPAGPAPRMEEEEDEDDFPFDDMELLVEPDEEMPKGERRFAEGGQTFMPAYTAPVGSRPMQPGRPNMGMGQAIENRTYENAEGETRVIPFLNGRPIRQIPTGFYPEGEVPAEARSEADTGGDEVDAITRRNRGDSQRQQQEDDFDPSSWGLEDFDRYSRNRNIGGSIMKLGAAALGSSLGPVAAIIPGVINQIQAGKTRAVLEEIDNRLKSSDLTSEEKDNLNRYRERISDDIGGMLGEGMLGDGLLGDIFGMIGRDQGYGDDEIRDTVVSVTGGGNTQTSAPQFKSTRTDDPYVAFGINDSDLSFGKAVEGKSSPAQDETQFSSGDLSFGDNVGNQKSSGAGLSFGTVVDNESAAAKQLEEDEAFSSGNLGFSSGGLVKRRKK